MAIRIMPINSVLLIEAPLIETDLAAITDEQWQALTPSGKSINDSRKKITHGEAVLLNSNVRSPLFKLKQGKAELIAVRGRDVDMTTVNRLQQRFKTAGSSSHFKASQSDNLHPAAPMPAYTPEPIKKEPEPPVAPAPNLDNFNKPAKGEKVFAKSCTRPFGDSQHCTAQEPAANFGVWSLFFGQAHAAMPLAMGNQVTIANQAVAAGQVAAAGHGVDDKSANEQLAIALTKASGGFSESVLDSMQMAAGNINPMTQIALLLFRPNQYVDDTIYTNEDLQQLSEAQTRIRFQFEAAVEGEYYPRVTAYHTDNTRIPVKYVGRDEDNNNLLTVKLEDGCPTIYWTPDLSNEVKPYTTPPHDDDFDSQHIFVNPLPDTPQGYTEVFPMPDETSWQDCILIFPEDTGISPMYLLYKTSPRDEAGVVTGKGKDVEWKDGYWLGEATNQGQGQYIPTKIADKLRGKEFANFREFREAFWMAVSKDEKLLSQFKPSNISNIKNGKAPSTVLEYWHGEKIKFELHHVIEIQHGGDVYNIDNIRIVTPHNHYGKIHRKK